MRDILGGKGAGLAEMANLGLPVPPGFTISAKLCLTYLERGTFPDGLREEVARHLKQLEHATKRKFGSRDRPLLVSVRSGAAVSMPGMMETILNLGLNDETVQGLVADSKNPNFAYDSYRRFVHMYGDVVFDLGRQPFAEVLEECKRRRKVERDIDLPPEELQALVRESKAIVQAKAGVPFPDDPMHQLWGAIEAVFRSWRTRRAVDYRRIHGIPEDLGTAVNVVAMVYGNMGEDSGTGVAFTRDCSSGENVLNGDFLVNAQGEDVVSGARTPQPIARLKRGRLARVFGELARVAQKLERHFKDVQDIEFTFERGKLYMLQTRRAQRTGLAAVRIAADMVDDGLITADEAVQRVPPHDLDQLFHPMVDPRASTTVVAKGMPASPGAAIGEAVFDADLAVALAKKGRKVILVRPETSPEDFHGIVAAQAVLTARGGMTSHAAIVARGMGKTCVVGAKDIEVDPHGGRFRANGRVVKQGQVITVDGTSGRVLLGAAKVVEPKAGSHYAKLMAWADQRRRLRVRANADTPADAKRARELGAEGIGLCRTEHMFFQGDRITAMREMIVAADEAGRRRALAKLLPMQRHDFEGIFEAMAGLPVTIRLLDPPLHEFLPHTPEELATLAKEMRLPVAKLKRLVGALVEANPMLGHRGCRLGITYPEITEMQARAIFEAACRVGGRGHKGMVEGRRGPMPAVLCGARHPAGRPVPGARPGGGRQTDRDRGAAGARHAHRSEGGDLRRARRRAGLGEVLPPRRHELRVVLAVPGADRPARGRAGGARGAGRHQPHESDGLGLHAHDFAPGPSIANPAPITVPIRDATAATVYAVPFDVRWVVWMPIAVRITPQIENGLNALSSAVVKRPASGTSRSSPSAGCRSAGDVMPCTPLSIRVARPATLSSTNVMPA